MQLRTDRDKVAHLLRRFAFGASEQEIEYYGAGGTASAIDRLLNYESVEAPTITIEDLQQKEQAVKPQLVRAWWIARMLLTKRPLEEKMTLFWHDHFATSDVKVTSGPMLLTQNEILRSNAVGDFRTLLLEVSQDPAMIFWLDNQYNVKGKPNENFAREVMELFTLGIGSYSEKDIQEAARAFTGWQYGRPSGKEITSDKVKRASFVFRQNLHDTGEKTVLGKTGSFKGEDVLALLCEQPQCARYISTKLWEWFAYPKPSAALVERLAKSFRDSGMSIKALLRTIMESPEFYSDTAVRALYKNPVDFTVSTLRQMGVAENLKVTAQGSRAGLAPLQSVMLASKAMGMELLAPPDVSGWSGGQDWISSATMLERIKWADRLFGTPPPGKAQGYARLSSAGLFDTESPVDAVSRLVSIFDAPMSGASIAKLNASAQSASGGKVTRANANQVADTVCRMIFGSPEFQFA